VNTDKKPVQPEPDRQNVGKELEMERNRAERLATIRLKRIGPPYPPLGRAAVVTFASFRLVSNIHVHRSPDGQTPVSALFSCSQYHSGTRARCGLASRSSS
jgi:hypothetical protein